jgi:histidinol-phosphate aminotransferase
MHAFDNIDCITKVFPSEGNFILIETKKTEYIFQSLIEKQIITRNRSSLIPNTIRISVGTAKENEELINTLKSL